MGLNRRTVYDQISKLDTHGKIEYKAGPSRKRTLDDQDILVILDYLTENPDASCPDISAHLCKLKEIDVSAKVVRGVLADLEHSFQLPTISFFMKQVHKESRVEWAQANRNTDWKEVIFSDETTFWSGRSGVTRWMPPDSVNVHMIPKNLLKLNLWAGICWNGQVSLYIFRENLTRNRYADILTEKLPEMKALYRSTSAWTLQQGNDPKHTSGNKLNSLLFLLAGQSQSQNLVDFVQLYSMVAEISFQGQSQNNQLSV